MGHTHCCFINNMFKNQKKRKDKMETYRGGKLVPSLIYIQEYPAVKNKFVYYPRVLLLPLACPPPKFLLAFTNFLLRLESVLFSLAAFLSICLLPLDLPTIYCRYTVCYCIYGKSSKLANNNTKN
jgi:hypothetical protein